MRITRACAEFVEKAKRDGFTCDGILALVRGQVGGKPETPVLALKQARAGWSGGTWGSVQADTRTFEELEALALKGELEPKGQGRLKAMLDEREFERREAQESARFRSRHAGMDREAVAVVLREGGAR